MWGLGWCLYQPSFLIFYQRHFLLGSYFQGTLFDWGWYRHGDGRYRFDGEGWFGLLVRVGGCFGGVFGWGGFKGWLGADVCDRLWFENCHCKHKEN